MRNPFRFGPPIASADEFFGREQIIDEMLSLVAKGQPCSIVGERRIGKTSLLLHIADPSARDLIESKMDPALVVYLDFQGHRDLTIETFWRVLIEEVAQQAQTQGLDRRVLGPLQELQAVDELDVSDVRRLAVEFARVGTRLLLLFDEFEYVADSNALDLPFFGGLRSLIASNLPVTCITASRKTLSEIDRFASGYSFVSSPFFNVFTTFRLGALKELDAIALLTKSLQGTGVEFNSDDVEFLYGLSGYHPFFLQMAAYYLFEESTKQPQVSGREKRLSAQSRFSEQCQAHFDYYWSNSTDAEKTVLTAYAQGQPQVAEGVGESRRIQSETAVRSLADRVLLVPSRDEDGSYRLVSTSLAGWIRETVPAEARPSAAEGLTPEDFKRLPRDGTQFEALVRQLLEAMGYHLLEKPVADADTMPDVLAERVVKDAAIERRERVVVECKHYAHSGKAVSSRDVGVWHDAMTSHEATGYLLVTDTRVTESLGRSFREFTEDETNHPKWAAFWDVDDLINHLNEHPSVRDAFFPPIWKETVKRSVKGGVEENKALLVASYLREAALAGLDIRQLPDNLGAMLECIVRQIIGQDRDRLSREHRQMPSADELCRLLSYLGWYMFNENITSCDATSAATVIEEVLIQAQMNQYGVEQMLDWLATTYWLQKTSRGEFEFRDSYIINAFAAMELKWWFSTVRGPAVLGLGVADNPARWQKAIVLLAGMLTQDQAIELLEVLLDAGLIQLAGWCVAEGQPMPQPIVARVIHALLA